MLEKSAEGPPPSPEGQVEDSHEHSTTGYGGPDSGQSVRMGSPDGQTGEQESNEVSARAESTSDPRVAGNEGDAPPLPTGYPRVDLEEDRREVLGDQTVDDVPPSRSSSPASDGEEEAQEDSNDTTWSTLEEPNESEVVNQSLVNAPERAEQVDANSTDPDTLQATEDPSSETLAQVLISYDIEEADALRYIGFTVPDSEVETLAARLLSLETRQEELDIVADRIQRRMQRDFEEDLARKARTRCDSFEMELESEDEGDPGEDGLENLGDEEEDDEGLPDRGDGQGVEVGEEEKEDEAPLDDVEEGKTISHAVGRANMTHGRCLEMLTMKDSPTSTNPSRHIKFLALVLHVICKLSPSISPSLIQLPLCRPYPLITQSTPARMVELQSPPPKHEDAADTCDTREQPPDHSGGTAAHHQPKMGAFMSILNRTAEKTAEQPGDGAYTVFSSQGPVKRQTWRETLWWQPATAEPKDVETALPTQQDAEEPIPSESRSEQGAIAVYENKGNDTEATPPKSQTSEDETLVQDNKENVVPPRTVNDTEAEATSTENSAEHEGVDQAKEDPFRYPLPQPDGSTSAPTHPNQHHPFDEAGDLTDLPEDNSAQNQDTESYDYIYVAVGPAGGRMASWDKRGSDTRYVRVPKDPLFDAQIAAMIQDTGVSWFEAVEALFTFEGKVMVIKPFHEHEDSGGYDFPQPDGPKSDPLPRAVPIDAEGKPIPPGTSLNLPARVATKLEHLDPVLQVQVVELMEQCDISLQEALELVLGGDTESKEKAAADRKQQEIREAHDIDALAKEYDREDDEWLYDESYNGYDTAVEGPEQSIDGDTEGGGSDDEKEDDAKADSLYSMSDHEDGGVLL
ncbi:uncharacterized protein BDZ99DRAFT_500611 [Mytilinidion resinicola]|uniref:Uncharacterized protein n=1 Tax=Mytilinidion resinicola TaxID=574789 RepID=A0A6A6YF46_9PEZI|nr:uncharacterized protein BDZ99DRAFT_500611 [Mytilinidion resinicola]KAF2807411.1 hypothetical protein BDZ99DRAFT_500611 [Mytilinidion resinicola]